MKHYITLTNSEINERINGSAEATAGNPVTLSIVATIRQGCMCDGADTLTFTLTEGAGTVENISVCVEKV